MTDIEKKNDITKVISMTQFEFQLELDKVRLEQKAIDIDKACNAFCHTGCPHKTDSFNCLNNKCETWKIFRRLLEE